MPARSFASLLLLPTLVSPAPDYSPSHFRERKIAGEYPVLGIEIIGATPRPIMFVKVADSVALHQLVNLERFGQFRPGITLEQAPLLYGPPFATRGRSLREGGYLQYRTSTALVEVAYEPSSSGCGTYHRRTLYAYPLSKEVLWPVLDVLHTKIVEHIPQTPRDDVEVIVASGSDDERVWCVVRGSRVESLNWLAAFGGV